jgi:hypothetical protein
MSGVESQSPQRRKLYLLADELGLTRQERMEMARYLLRRDLPTFKALDEAQVCRMLDALEGAQLFIELMRQRPLLAE